MPQNINLLNNLKRINVLYYIGIAKITCFFAPPYIPFTQQVRDRLLLRRDTGGCLKLPVLYNIIGDVLRLFSFFILIFSIFFQIHAQHDPADYNHPYL